MKIIIIALSGIGDALMFSPALSILRKNIPDAQIDLLAMHKGVEELYFRNRKINTVYFRDLLHSNFLSTLLYILRLRRNKYDVSITVYPANRWHYNIISFIIGAKQRLGHKYNHANLRSLYFLNTVLIREDNNKHNVEENIEFIKRLVVNNIESEAELEIKLTDDDDNYADNWMKKSGLQNKSMIIGFHAGSSLLKNHQRRRWDPKKYAQLGNLLMKNHSAIVLLFGGPEEYGLNESINQMMNSTALIVKVPSLMISVAIMKWCSLFVVNDSGLMHIAAGLKLPIVTVFAYTNPVFVHPWKTKYLMVRKEMECSPCFYYSPRPATCIWKEDKFRCITQISVDEVYSAVLKLIQEIEIN